MPVPETLTRAKEIDKWIDSTYADIFTNQEYIANMERINQLLSGEQSKKAGGRSSGPVGGVEADPPQAIQELNIRKRLEGKS